MKAANKFPVLKKDYFLKQCMMGDMQAFAILGLRNEVRIELNEDGLFMLNKFTGEFSIAEITSSISETFNVSREKASASLQAIITDLEKRDIIYLANQKCIIRKFPKKITTRGIVESVYIKLTNACNLNCLHCSVNARQKLKDELAEEYFFAIIDQIHDMMIPAVVITGGEPTLARYLPELVHYASNKPLDITLMTNGYTITRPYAERLIKNGLKTVDISIDGANENTHNAFRGTKGAFKRALQAIKIFKELGAEIGTTTVITKDNYLEVEEILKFKQEHKIDIMNFLPIMPRERGKNCDYKASYSVYVNDTLRKTLHLRGNLVSLEKGADKGSLFGKNIRCTAGTQVLTIEANGDVLPCINFPSIVLGNLKEKSLYEIYNHSSKIKDVQDTVKIKGSECEKCSILNYCNGGCVNIAYCYSGKFSSCDIVRREEVKAMMKRQGIEVPGLN